MKNGRRFLSGVLLAAMLLAALPVSASAAGYADMTDEHWAYDDMVYAAQLGIINGIGNNRMGPNLEMSWGQCLAMVTRAFAPASYQSAQNSGLPWDAAGLKAAQDNGLILPYDFLPVDAGSLSAPISRQDMAVLLYRALPEEARRGNAPGGETGGSALSDWNRVPASYQEAVDALFRLRVIRGKDDGSFGGTDTLRRSDGSVLLMRAVSVLDARRRGQTQALTLRFVGTDGTEIAVVPAQAAVGDSFYFLREKYVPDGYNYADDDTFWFHVSSIQTSYTIPLRPLRESEIAADKFNRGEMTWEELMRQDFWLKEPGDNARKRMLLFGTTETWGYPNRATAQAKMTSVTVPVWKLSNGNKTASTLTIQINAALADDVKEIFTEIFNDPERFPIYSIGGFAWLENAKGEHACGSAIDINPNENYQVRNGVAETGSLWQPGVNPYSIPTNGSVVRAFQAHGWSWGGDAWAGYSDQTTGYHDYMHFSYIGR